MHTEEFVRLPTTDSGVSQQDNVVAPKKKVWYSHTRENIKSELNGVVQPQFSLKLCEAKAMLLRITTDTLTGLNH